MPTFYRYPKSGRIRYSVQVADNGAISVKRGDWLSKYSMAIHGTGGNTREYARMRGSALKPVENINLIYAGETLYHIPTWNSYQKRQSNFDQGMVINGDSGKAPKPTVNDELQQVKDYLQREVGFTLDDAKIFGDIILGLNITGRAISALAWETITVVTVPAGLSAAAAIAAPILALVSGFLGLYRVLGTGHRVTGSIAFCYGLTAWVYDDPVPGFSKKLAALHRKNGVHGDNLQYHQAAWDKSAVKGYLEGPALAKQNEISDTALKLALRFAAKDNSSKLCQLIADGIAKNIDQRVERPSFLNAVKDGGCSYNA